MEDHQTATSLPFAHSQTPEKQHRFELKVNGTGVNIIATGLSVDSVQVVAESALRQLHQKAIYANSLKSGDKLVIEVVVL